MKKKILICILSVLALTGCKKDSMENITIYTSTYPIEYITKELYEDHSTVNSIYPNEIINLSDKLIKDYSTANLFVYNGLSNEKEYAVKMLNNNKNLMIVDASMGMEIEKRTDSNQSRCQFFSILQVFSIISHRFLPYFHPALQKTI